MTGTNFWQGFWRLADPKISLASFAGLWLGACVAAAGQGLHWGWLALTVAGVFCVEVAKNASGEIVDYNSGVDLAVKESERTPFSGGKRVLVDGLLSRSQARAIALLFYLAAITSGLLLAWLRDPRIIYFGLIGMALAWYYHGGSLRLAYRGLGELAVAIAYGPVVVCGTYFVQAGHIPAHLLLVSGALGLHIAGFLWINELPDLRADEANDKRNLVVRLGRKRAAISYAVMLTISYSWLALTAVTYPGSNGYLWGLVGMPLAMFSVQRVLRDPGDIPTLVGAQAACLGGFVTMAFAAGLGYALA